MSAQPFRRLPVSRRVLVTGSVGGLIAIVLLAAATTSSPSPPPEDVVVRDARGAKAPDAPPPTTERKRDRGAAAPAPQRTAGPAADFADERFYKAYFLESQQHDYAAAAELYTRIATDRSAPAELRDASQARAASCREELASADFTALVPAGTLAYVELNRPGEQVSGLLAQLGLLRDGEPALGVREAGQLGVSRAAVEGLLGLRGAAAAITGFDPSQGKPSGVAILHPGEMEVLRALIQDALNLAATPVEAIGGHPTYCVENEVFLTFTSRLIVVSQQRGEIEGVIRRLSGDDEESLRNDSHMAAALKDRDGALLFFALNFKPVLPLIQAAMAVGGTQSPELAAAQALLDPASLDTLVGQVSMREQGIRVDLSLRLADENRNLAFHFLRLPPIDPRTLARIPAGCASFFAMALNQAGEPAAPPDAVDLRVPPAPVSLLDLGRELYGNVVGVAGFVPTGMTMQIERERVPAAALVFTVRDPRHSRALWTELLGVASLATRSGPLDGARVDIEGVSAQRFDLPEGISIYLAFAGNDVLLSPSKEAIAAALRCSTEGESVLNDPAYSSSLGRIGRDSTIAVFAHAGRCIELARPMMGERDAEELSLVFGAANDLVGSLVVDHSPNTLRISLMATGLPQVGPILTDLLHRRHGRTRTRFVHELDELRTLPIVRYPREIEVGEPDE